MWKISGIVVVSLVAGVAGCGSSGSSESPGNPPSDRAFVECMATYSLSPFQAGMVGNVHADAGGLTVTLEAAMPSPPAAGQNVWTLRVVDANGQAVTGATLELAQWMEVGRHPGPNFPKSAEMGHGEYRLQPVDFTMSGFWQNSVEVKQSAMGIDETAEFDFCIR